MSQLSQSQIISEIDEYVVLYTQESHKKRPKYHDGLLKHYKYNSKFQVLTLSNAVVSSEFKLGFIVNEGDEIKVGSTMVNVESLKSRESRNITGIFGKNGVTEKDLHSVRTPSKQRSVSPLPLLASANLKNIGIKRRRIGLSKSEIPNKQLIRAKNAQGRTIVRAEEHSLLLTNERKEEEPSKAEAATSYEMISSENQSVLSSGDDNHELLEIPHQAKDFQTKDKYKKEVIIPTDLSNLMNVQPERPKLRVIRHPRREPSINNQKLQEISTSSIAAINVSAIEKGKGLSINEVSSKKQVPLTKMISNLNKQVVPVKSVFETFKEAQTSDWEEVEGLRYENDPDSDEYDVLWKEDSPNNTPSKVNFQRERGLRVKKEEYEDGEEYDEIIATPSLELHENEVIIKTKTHDFKKNSGGNDAKLYRISEL